METEVYANDNEICSKAADGKSAAAFPDVCWSPPGPAVGPIPLPYPNTAYASDLAEGTNSVTICGQPVAKRDISYFAKSTGDEGATQSYAKNLNTGVIQGKAYFVSWSADVFVEGQNVPRHTDLMTHNHASPTPGTPPAFYLDTPAIKRKCKKTIQAIEKACEDKEDKKSNKSKNLAVITGRHNGFMRKIKQKLAKLESKKRNEKSDAPGTKDNAWMDDHCTGLWIKPSLGTDALQDIKEFVDNIDDMVADLDKIVMEVLTPIVEELARKLGRKAFKKLAEKGGKWAARSGGKIVVGASGAAGGPAVVVTEAIMLGWTIYDLATTGYELYTVGKQLYSEYSTIMDIMEIYKSAQANLREAVDAMKDVTKHPAAAMASAMGALSRINSCTRARRCKLVKYNQTNSAASLAGKGCCPGQTGHHVIPDSVAKSGCKPYAKGSAPTLCVEGTTNVHGTHGQISRAWADAVKKYKAGPRLFGSSETMSYSQARDIAIDTIQDTFPESMCSKACLKAQLDEYYKALCKGDLTASEAM